MAHDEYQMATIELTTLIDAPAQRVFDLARSIDLHVKTAGKSREQAVAGVTTGLIGLGQTVTWKASHFGVWQTLTVEITAFEPPHSFSDSMLSGAFRRMEHRHSFEQTASGTVMRDVFTFESPLGILGKLVDAIFLKRYMSRFLIERNRILKLTAESGEWSQYCPPSS